MAEEFVAYWLGYADAVPPITTLPTGIDVVNLFVLNLESTSSGTTLSTSYISSNKITWDSILLQAQGARANGVKVCASIIPPASGINWNTIPDPTAFAANVYTLIAGWELDGIDIDPEQGDLNPPGGNFTAVMQALGQYFGPQSTTGLRMSYASYDFAFDNSFLSQNADLFDVVQLMDYTANYLQMQAEFDMYSSVVPSANLLIGINANQDSSNKTSFSETIDLAKWVASSGGTMGGMMEFNINADTDFQFANGIIATLPGSTAARRRSRRG
jgi:chitinase